MQASDFSQYEIFFNSYVKRFDSQDEPIHKNIELKRDHTHRVLGHIKTIGAHLNLNAQELLIAKTIALFHDIGRFYQFQHYKTFDDSVSENHAKLSVEILETENVLNALPEKEKRPILKAMTDYYLQLEKNNNPALEHHLPNDESYNPVIVEDILNYRNSNQKLVRSQYDQRLLTLTWIFDINYNISLEIVRDNHYIEKTMKVLPGNEEMSHVGAVLKRYLRERLGG